MTTFPEVGFRQSDSLPQGIEIITLDSLKKRFGKVKHDPHKPHKVSFNSIMMISGGNGKHMVDFVNYPVTAGNIVIIPRGAVNSFSQNFDLKGWSLLFTDDFLKGSLLKEENFRLNFILDNEIKTKVLHLNTKEKSFFIDHFQYLYDEFRESDNSDRNPILPAYLKILLIKALTIAENTSFHDISPNSFGEVGTVIRLNDLLEKNGKKERNASWYAERLGQTYKNLNNICVKTMGKSLKQHISSTVILQIQRELAATERSLKEMSWLFNFDEPTNFTKYYKRYAGGETPGEFRKKVMK